MESLAPVSGNNKPRDANAGEPSTPADDHTPRTLLDSASAPSIMRDIPSHLHPLAYQIHTLSGHDIVHIANLTENVAARSIYSMLPYSGTSWFLPRVSSVEEGQPNCAFSYEKHGTVYLTLCGRCIKLPLLSICIRLITIVLFGFMLWNILPKNLMEPGGYVWDPLVLVVVSAFVGSFISRLLQIPPLVGVLWVAVAWSNIPSEKYLTSGVALQLRSIASKLGLTVIMLRAGFSMTLKGILPQWKQALLMATIPFLFECVAHSLIANQVFGYGDNYSWAFLHGTICSIVSPAVVVPGVLYLQKLGYGLGTGPLSLMLAAVGIEIMIGVWAANFIIDMIFYDRNITVSVVLGPVQFIVGAAIGAGIGAAFFHLVEVLKNEASRLPNGKFHRKHFKSCLDFATFIFIVLGVTMVFVGKKFNLDGGGCTMCVFFASTVKNMCVRGQRHELLKQQEHIGGRLALLWDNIVMPVLFSMMGTNISLKSIFNSDFFPKAIICLAGSTAVRLVVIFVAQLGSGFPLKHKLLVCVAYSGKASAQASLGPMAADIVAQGMTNHLLSALLPEHQEFANIVQQMSAMYVMFMAPIASVCLMHGGMAVLQRAVEEEGRVCPCSKVTPAEQGENLSGDPVSGSPTHAAPCAVEMHNSDMLDRRATGKMTASAKCAEGLPTEPTRVP
ncbi:hypothetical protein TRVL_02389 [Trypanosoma vivax]|nr:hypothetical protein TRVL_02389 [Trypanosoma vivax]